MHLSAGNKKKPWTQTMGNKLDRSAQVNDARFKSNYRVNFIHQRYVPNDRKFTHEKFVCDYRPLKSNQYIISLVVGGDKLDYSLKNGSPVYSMLKIQPLVNSVISYAKEGYRLMRCDLKYLFVCTTMDT